MTSPRECASPVVYQLGPDNRILSVNPAWDAFALANQAPHLQADCVVGESLFSYFSGMETSHLYEVMIDRVRQNQHATVVSFRCDAPSMRRFMELKIAPLPGSVLEFSATTLRQESRQRVSVLDVQQPRSDEMLKMCAWCKRVDLSGDWVEIEQAIESMDLFHRAEQPRITHGICRPCVKIMEQPSLDSG